MTLPKALRKCHKLAKGKRAKCKAQAYRRYGNRTKKHTKL